MGGVYVYRTVNEPSWLRFVVVSSVGIGYCVVVTVFSSVLQLQMRAVDVFMPCRCRVRCWTRRCVVDRDVFLGFERLCRCCSRILVY